MKIMTKTLLLSLIMFTMNVLSAQITLEKSFPDDEVVRSYTNGNDLLYYSYTSNGNVIKVYNADYTLRNTINVPLPPNYTMWIGGNYYDTSPYSISKNIFNTDDKYEFIISAYYYDTTNQKTFKKFLLINEDGTLIKDFHPNAGVKNFSDLYHVYHDQATNQNKLLVENAVGNSYENQIDIYLLPTSELGAKEISSTYKLSAFPIPTSKMLNIINPKNGASKVEIFDVTGKLLLNKSYVLSENKISIDVENLPNGIYIYRVGNLSAKFIKN